jgi:hypothetical protein
LEGATVAAILGNPRYAGRQVWNRQRSEYDRVPDGDRVMAQRWNPAQDWVISTRPAHPALVSEADFVAAQVVRAARMSKDGAARTYRLAGLLTCGICGRRMDSHWVNDRPGYRCRHGHTSATTPGQRNERERSVYVREDELLHDLATTLQQDNAAHDLVEIPALLRAQKITIMCDHSRRALARDQPQPAR